MAGFQTFLSGRISTFGDKVELFFRWIKQHLRIKAFYGTSENAVKTDLDRLVGLCPRGHRQEVMTGHYCIGIDPSGDRIAPEPARLSRERTGHSDRSSR